MSLKTAVLKTGATWAPTGGTDLTLTPDGRDGANSVSLVVVSDEDLITRRTVTARATMPPLTVNDRYARLARNQLTYKIPFIASDGRLYIQPCRLETAFHPEYTQANKEAVINDLPAFLADSDFLLFWQDSLLS